MASVTAWLSRYREDIFFKSEVRILALHGLLGVLLVAAVFFVYYERRVHTEQEIIDIVGAPYVSGPLEAELEGALISDMKPVRAEDFIPLIIVITGLTIVIGYFVSRSAFAPARRTLESQKRFVGNIAHELRTPLAIIKTNSEIALLENDVLPEVRKMVESNIEELDRVSQIINNLLTLSALIRPEQIEFASLNVTDIIRAVVNKYAMLATRGAIHVAVRTDGDGSVWGNAAALQQIFGNILKNAIVYTPRGGSVMISVWPAANDRVEVVVRDTGIGIAQEDLAHIFNPFFRSDPSRTRSSSGSGLGLTIVSELVKLHHGEIHVRSSVGTGTEVTISLPATKLSAEGANTVAITKSEVSVDYSRG